MKTINLNTKSWHYFLAVTVASFNTNTGDFCSYVRNVILGLVLSVMLGTVLGAIGVSLLAGLCNIVLIAYHLIVGTAYTAPVFLQFGTVLLIAITAMVGLVTGWIVIKDFISARLENRALANEGKPDSFMKAAYKSFKDKVCFKIDFN